MGRFRLRNRVVEASEPDPLFPVPTRFNFTRDVVEAAADAHAYRSAMTFVDRDGIIDRRTYMEFAREANCWTSLFRSRGLVAGDRIVVLVGRTPVWHSIILGALKGGFVAVPCPEAFTTDELMQRFVHCGARAVVTDRAHAPASEFDELLVVDDLKEALRAGQIGEPTHDTAANDPAFVLYTSGTTGPPRGAIHTHASTWAMRLPAEHWLDVRPDDLVWWTADTGDASFVWNSLIGPWSAGTEIALHDGEFAIEERFDLIARLGITVLAQPPSEYRLMAEHAELERFSIGNVRHAVATGAPLDPHVVDTFRDAFGVTIHDGYGQAETGITIASRRNDEIGVGFLGAPVPGCDIAVIDEGGNELEAGVEGEIALRGRPPSLFAGYWNDSEETDASFLGVWYLTGDRAIRDSDGNLRFLGRSGGQRSARREAQERAAAAAEQADAEAEARERQADDERRRHEEQRAAASAATAAAAAVAATTTGAQEPVEEPAPATRSRREEAAGRRAAKAEAKEAERARKADEKRRRHEAKAAAQAARRDEADAKRAAEAKAREDENQRKREEKRRKDEEKAEAERIRREEAAAKRAAQEAGAETERRERESRKAATRTTTTPDPADIDEEEGERISAELIARLRVYGHGSGGEGPQKDAE